MLCGVPLPWPPFPMNHLPRHLGAYLSMTLICFFSLLPISSQEPSLVFPPPQGHSPVLYSIHTLTGYCSSLTSRFLPCFQICLIPQPLSLQSPVCTVPAKAAPPVWSDHHNVLLLPQSLTITVLSSRTPLSSIARSQVQGLTPLPLF